ncbi:BREX-1 system adenine-specific DNA-methyltransferase PglX, partial [bacterium]|nr:BREX-1 system adenine-specific DNA-methyltransferase PglX [bacterium]
MAFDTKTRNRLNQFVGDARALLTDKFTEQCQVEFGMNPETGEVTKLERLSHLDDAQRQTAIILRETLNHYYANLPTKQKDQAKDYQSLIERIVREQAFTILNRLCAIRMAEARDLVIESIGAGVQSKGFQLYQHVCGNSLGETGAAYQQYLLSLFDEFGVDLPVLFDRYSPQGRLFPRETVLTDLIGMINDPEINHLWAEDETIGWIYQYFNSKEERKAMRDASQAPRNSRELAVRNQFFTPRYVVEFLTDNTLGRIWYEMRKGETNLKESCQYLVRRPNEFFLLSLADYSVEEKFSGASEMKAFWATANPDELPDNPNQIVIFDWLGRIAPDKNANEELGFESCLDQSHQDFMAQWMEALSSPNYVEWIEQQNALNLMHALWRSGVQASRAQTYPLDPILNNEEAGPLWTRLLELLRQKGKENSQEDLLNQPVFIPSRPLKDPREIRMLDPACGSMHFGLYAFDLYLKVYEEFWDLVTADPAVSIESTDLPSLTETYDSRDAFVRDVPRLIIEHNIHGIDIDPRAVQIAGLSLWLRAQRAWKSQGIAAGNRPQVTRSNVVCAEPMPGDQDQLEAFCLELHPAIAQMVTAIFEEMKLAGEAGSLLKIEEEISSLVTRAKKQYQDNPPEQKSQGNLFGLPKNPKQQKLEFDLSGITDQQFFEQAEETIYEALRKYASETSEGGFRRKLFAGDAEKGFAFVELCQKNFDVALMNPPFGEPSNVARSYVGKKFPEGKADILCCFVDRMQSAITGNGIVGVLSNRS